MTLPTEYRVLSICSYISAQKLKPGDRLPSESDLAVALSTTLHNIREGLSLLESLGIVERHPKAGTIIQELSPELVETRLLVLLRKVFEGLGLKPKRHRLAALRRVMEKSIQVQHSLQKQIEIARELLR